MRITKFVPLLTAIALACAQPEHPSSAPVAVQTTHAQKAARNAGVRYSATVEPDVQSAVAFRVGGYVEAVSVEEGDRVSRGTVLARIRQSDYRDRLSQVAASRSEAEAGLARSEKDLARARSLFEAGALTKPELDAAVASFDMMRSRVAAGRAATGEAGLALRDTSLVAPFDGVILRRNIETGDLGTPGFVAFVVAQTGTVRVKFGVPDTMLPSVKIGAAIPVTTESLPSRTFNGTVARISPAADAKSRAFEVELHIDNAQNELKPGMVASLEVVHAAAPPLAIPLGAVIRSPKSREHYAVYVVEDNKVRAHDVELGEPLGNLVAVTGGLTGDEEIVVSGPALLADGQAVRTVDGGSYAQK
jgi:RND family efflux transporter MFP subunit